MRRKSLEELLAEYDEAKDRTDRRDRMLSSAVGLGCLLVVIGIAVAFGFLLVG